MSWLSEHEALGSLRGTAGYWESLQCLTVTGLQRLTEQSAGRSELMDMFLTRGWTILTSQALDRYCFCWVEEHFENNWRDFLLSRFLAWCRVTI